MSQLRHPNLGLLNGKEGHGIVQFLGIKYASLEHRFGSPSLNDGVGPSQSVDATKIGPAVIGILNGCEAEFALIQQSLPVPDFPPQSDTECLNLTITIPKEQPKDGELLPVFVYLHGGALAFGSGTWPQYDQSAIVRRSVEIEKPVIGVVINYRTGIFGFLTSEELRKAGFKANNGFRDQKVAFQWVRKHIAGFGGDPNQVTAIGQSAGGVSATTLLQSPEPLFERLVDLSGTCLLRRPMPLAVHEQFYQQFCEAHSLATLSGEARIKAINKIDSHELLLKTPPSIPSLPALDNDMLRVQINFVNAKHWSNLAKPAFPGLVWCKALLIGDCAFDANIFQRALHGRESNIGQQLSGSLNRSIPDHESAIASLIDDYGITTAPNEFLACTGVLQLVNDLFFYLPCETFAQYFPGTKYVYHLNEPNPWEGPFKGQAAHILDATFLFKNFDDALESKTRSVAEAFSDNILTFIYGEGPWEASTSEQRQALVYGGVAGKGKLVDDKPENVGRRDIIFRYEKTVGHDALLVAVNAFLAGK